MLSGQKNITNAISPIHEEIDPSYCACSISTRIKSKKANSVDRDISSLKSVSNATKPEILTSAMEFIEPKINMSAERRPSIPTPKDVQLRHLYL